MTALISFTIALVVACPWISEVLPDPISTSDQLGEFLEIANVNPSESIFVYLDSQIIASGLPTAPGYMLFCHQNFMDSIPCHSLLKAIPNSTPMLLRVQQSFCRDTAWLMPSKPGNSWQRIDSTSMEWILENPSAGYPWPNGPHIQNAYGDISWIMDSTGLVLATMELNGAGAKQIRWQYDTIIDTLDPLQPFAFQINSQWNILNAEILGDDYPLDNKSKRWIGTSSTIPLQITEMHKQNEIEPDWIEIRNNSHHPLWINEIQLSNMETLESDQQIQPYSFGVFTENWEKLRFAYPSLKDIPHGETSRSWNMSYSDSIHISLQGVTIVSDSWGNTRNLKSNATPGYQPANMDSKPRLHSQYVSKNGMPLILHIWMQSQWLLTWMDQNDLTYTQKLDEIGTIQIPVPSHLHSGPAHIILQNQDQYWVYRMVILP